MQYYIQFTFKFLFRHTFENAAFVYFVKINQVIKTENYYCRDDCGKCTNCKDKPKFGGRNVLKQACELRVCLEMSVREKPKREKRGPKKGPRRTEDNDDDEDIDGDDEDIDESTVQRQQLNQDSNLRGSSR